MKTSQSGDDIDIRDQTIQHIKDRVLDAEKEQRHLERPHNILPQIRKIIREEVDK